MGTGGGGSSSPKMQAHGLSRMSSRPMDSSQPCRVDELDMVWVPIAFSHSKQPSESLIVLNCQKTNFCSDLCWLEVIKKMETWMFFFTFFYSFDSSWDSNDDDDDDSNDNDDDSNDSNDDDDGNDDDAISFRFPIEMCLFEWKTLDGKKWDSSSLSLSRHCWFLPFARGKNSPEKKSLSLVLSYFDMKQDLTDAV